MDCATCHKAWRCTFACPEMNAVLDRVEDELSRQFGAPAGTGFTMKSDRTGSGQTRG